ncbi:unnamed protein product [Fraxinus pennsylvanica]|uniref:Replication factor C subunit n=1 Tax=Fraxinus pennsylvanica TaxID=56036 RepID=A0AAD2ADC5_9LAMI|nr:unnamed protein product [Fraxinus pennsylvanica]
MPSPPISRSNSAPDVSTRSHSLLHSGVHKPVLSAGSLATAWPKQVSDFIKRKGSSSSKNIGLTEENLQEFNSRNAILETRYSTCSPYYKGVTDFSLDINRGKRSGSSPGRESHAATVVSSASKSSFVVKVQKGSSSSYTGKNREKSSSSSSFWSKSKGHTHAVTSDSTSSKETATGMIMAKIRTKKKTNDSELERKKISLTAQRNEDTTDLSNKKPLNEREQELPPTILSPTSPPKISSLTIRDVLLPPSPSLQLLTPLAQTPPTAAAQTPATEDYPPQISSQITQDQIFPLSPPIQLPPTLAQASPAGAAQTPATEDIVLKNEETKRTGNDRKYVWADKYRPFYLKDFLCNRRTALWLQDMVKTEECGHFIFEGLPGVGKKTMIWALLREAFGVDNVQAREECKEFYLKGEGVGSVLVNIMVSQQHIEVNLSELKGYEKHILFELIKERSTKLSNKALQGDHGDCRAIILYEADKISTDTLTYIKWILERFKGSNKVFFCCSDLSRLEPVKSLCTVVQLLPPSIEEIVEVLELIATQEGIHLPNQLAVKFANNSNNNLRQAIRSFEATWHFNSCLTEDQAIKNGWEDKIANLAIKIMQEQTPKLLYNIRGELQNLIEYAVAPEFIFKTLVKKYLDEYLQPLFDNFCNKYNRNHEAKKLMATACAWDQRAELIKIQTDSRKNVEQFMRIEEFIAKFMSWYKSLVVKNKEFCPGAL